MLKLISQQSSCKAGPQKPELRVQGQSMQRGEPELVPPPTFLAFPLLTVGARNPQDPVDGVGSHWVVRGAGNRRGGRAGNWMEEGGDTIRRAVETRAPGRDRQAQRAEGRTRAHSLFLPLRLEGGITPTDRHCRLLAQPGESGDRSTQASSATYGIYGPSSPLPSRWM
jgi:hypothetical protein